MGLKGLGSQTRPCLRITYAIFCVTILGMFYFLNDLSNLTYNDFVWNLSNEYGLTQNLTGPQDSLDSFNTTLREGYLVWSPSCRIPDINPYHESIRNLIKKVGLVKCSQLPPLTKVVDDRLIYDEKVASKYSNKQKMSCCYQHITRTPVTDKMSNPDDNFNMSPCIYLNKTVLLKNDQEFIMVKCNVPKKKGNKEVYSNIHARIIKKPIVEEKEKKSKLLEDKLSILFIGIDSISRLNLMRTMPNTVNFLKENDFIELKGYNKIDDNTFPNLIAILTGMKVNQLKNKCWKSYDTTLDKCPIIWKDASNLGYLTSYVEDEPKMGTFNYHKKGFKSQPTDYYFRPFMLAAEKYMKMKFIDGLLEVCMGPSLTSDHILNYAKDFIINFKNNLHFSLYWLNSFSHNNVNTPSSMDKKMYDFFKILFHNHINYNESLINSTMIIFLSDHGMRYGKIRETYVGWLEERLPFIYIWLPEWFRNKYKDNYENLLINTNRLTTPFDLHITLKDLILSKSIDENNTKHTSEACPDCRSLFQQIPWNRSCAQAGVTEHWCTCSEYRPLTTESVLLRAMTYYAVKEINLILESSTNLTTNNTRCAKLEVKKVLTVRSKLCDKPVEHNDYIVIFETLPGAGLFETTIRHDKTFKIMDSISRINAYHSQSKCINDAYLKKYCFCKKK